MKSYYAVLRIENGFMLGGVRKRSTPRFDNALDTTELALRIADANKKEGRGNINIRIVESERDPQIMRHCGYVQAVGEKCPGCKQTVTSKLVKNGQNVRAWEVHYTDDTQFVYCDGDEERREQ